MSSTPPARRLRSFAPRLLSAVAVALMVAALAPAQTAPAGADGHEAPGAPLANRSISAGAGHTCAIDDDGGVRCWGSNDYGQLGVADLADRGDTPDELGDDLPAIDLGTGRTATAVTTGDWHTCALLDDGTVKCWGDNQYGQLGLGDFIDRGDDPNEMGDNLGTVDFGTGRTATAIATGAWFNCALLDDASIKCWGANSMGQLGLGTTTHVGGNPAHMGENLLAVDLGTGRTPQTIAAGDRHACAILDDGSVKCWGRNNAGQLGLGDLDNRGDAPGEMGDALPVVDLGAGRTVSVIVGGSGHSCALLDNADVKCWGNNGNGQLGLGDLTLRGDDAGEMGDLLDAVDLGTGREAVAISAGDFHNCVIFDDATTACWGNGGSGRLGVGTVVDRGDDPGEMGTELDAVDLGTGRTAIAVTAGWLHTCAVLDDATVKCWGENDNGRLGLGDVADRGDTPGEMGDVLLSVDIPLMTRAVTPASDPTPPVVPEPTPISEPAPAPTCMGRAATIVGGPNRTRIVGTPGDDVIVTRNRGVKILGRGGNDIICGSAGRDTIRGGAGRDRIAGRGGNDRLFGNAGRDFIHGGAGRDTCDGGSARDRARACESTRRLR